MRTLAALLYRMLLRILPGSFRDAYGREAEVVFERMLADARQQGGRPAELRAAARGLLGILRVWTEETAERISLWPSSIRDAVRLRGLSLDLRYALRSMRRHSLATGVVILTLGLGLGATTAVFTVVRGVLLSPLPYPGSDRIVQIWQTHALWADSPNPQLQAFSQRFPLSGPTFRDWEVADLGYEAMGAFTGAEPVYQGPEGAEIWRGEHVTSGMFDVLGVAAQRGRTLLPEDDAPGSERVVVLSHGLWVQRFGQDPEVLDRAISLDGQAHRVVGVMPPDFRPLRTGSRLWLPLTEEMKAEDRGSQFLNVVARLAPESSLESTLDRLHAVQEGLAQADPEQREGIGARQQSLVDAVVGDVGSTLWLLFGAVLLVLLIACTNIAGVLSVLGLRRRRELAVRSAVGGSGGRIARGLLLEASMLVLAGGMAGVALAWLALPLLLELIPASLPRHEEIGVDGMVLLFGLGAAGATALLVGLIPALQVGRTDPASVLQASSRSATGDQVGTRARHALVVAEVALAFVLLVGAGLLAAGFHAFVTQERGFDTERLLVMEAAPDPLSFEGPEEEDRFLRELRAALEAIPGVEVTLTNQVPLSGTMSSATWEVEQPDGTLQERSVGVNVVLENYFQVLGVPMATGRALEAADASGTPQVAVVNEAMARALWPGEVPVGRRLRSGPDAEWIEVVGVSRDVRHALAGSTDPHLFLSVWQSHRLPLQWVLRMRGSTDGVSDLARAALHSVSPTTPVRSIRLLDDWIASSVAVPRFRMGFVGGLAAMAAVLALVGLYAVISLSVTHRRREIGVRMALGAEPADVVRGVLRTAAGLTGVGALLGIAGALGVSRVLERFLFEMNPLRPDAYLAVTGAILLIGLLAAWLPAVRAARVDPVEVLKAE